MFGFIERWLKRRRRRRTAMEAATEHFERTCGRRAFGTAVLRDRGDRIIVGLWHDESVKPLHRAWFVVDPRTGEVTQIDFTEAVKHGESDLPLLVDSSTPSETTPPPSSAASALIADSRTFGGEETVSKTAADPILERMLRPFSEMLDEKSAQRFVDFKADKVVQARVRKLAEKCNEGLLTPDEKSEYETIVAADSILSILKAKARYLLSKKRKPK
jgi:hypothetical protein